MITSFSYKGNTVKLGKLTVLVGQNNVGKTNLLRAICSEHGPKGCIVGGNVFYGEDCYNIINNWYDRDMAGCAEPRAGVFLFDAFSDGLHMTAQVTVMSRLQAVLKESPNTQAVIVTYSPFQLESVAIEDIRVMARRGDTIRIKSLAEHPELEKYSAGMRTDELWANLGEDWVLDETP